MLVLLFPVVGTLGGGFPTPLGLALALALAPALALVLRLLLAGLAYPLAVEGIKDEAPKVLPAPD